MRDFLDDYLSYTIDTEATATFHRWSAIVGVGAFLEKQIWIQHGATQYYPNQYVMLLGESGSRKSAAIKGFVRILRLAGYKTLAAEKTSKEKFFADMAAQHHTGDSDDIEDEILWGEMDKSATTPILIAADEANDFFGLNNIEFLSTLGSLWDFEGVYDIKYKTSKSDSIPNPNISILAGNTPTNFSLAFPPTIIGQGFFSRILLIHGEKTRPKIAWPTPPDPAATAHIVARLAEIKQRMNGPIEPSIRARGMMEQIYHQPDTIRDVRFTSYFNRRFTHLMKLAMVLSAIKLEKEISEHTVIQANTYLTYIQTLMPKALGEYGKSQDSETMQKALSIILGSEKPVPMKELTKQLIKDVKNISEVSNIVQKLIASQRIFATPPAHGNPGGFLPIREDMEKGYESDKFVDFDSWLTKEELGVKVS